MTNQSIIVYRNPVEAAFWESGMVFPLIGGLATTFLLFVFLMWAANKVSDDWRGPPNWMVITGGVISLVAGFFMFSTLMV